MEFDSLFTVIQTRNCSGNQLLLVWILWILMTATYCGMLWGRSGGGLILSLNNNDYVWVDSALGTFFIMSIMTTFGLFLLGDNSQPLDCISSLSNRSRSILRLIFLLLSCSVYLVLFVYLFLGVLADFYKLGKTTKKVPLQIELKG